MVSENGDGILRSGTKNMDNAMGDFNCIIVYEVFFINTNIDKQYFGIERTDSYFSLHQNFTIMIKLVRVPSAYILPILPKYLKPEKKRNASIVQLDNPALEWSEPIMMSPRKPRITHDPATLSILGNQGHTSGHQVFLMALENIHEGASSEFSDSSKTLPVVSIPPRN